MSFVLLLVEAPLGVLLLLRRLGLVALLLELADLLLHLVLLGLLLLVLLGLLLLELLGGLLEGLGQVLGLLLAQLALVELVGQLLHLGLGLVEVALLERLGQLLGLLVLGQLVAGLGQRLVDLLGVLLAVPLELGLGLLHRLEQLLLGQLAALGLVEQLLDLGGVVVELLDVVLLGGGAQVGDQVAHVRVVVGIHRDGVGLEVARVVVGDDLERHRADALALGPHDQLGLAELGADRHGDEHAAAGPRHDWRGHRAGVVADVDQRLGGVAGDLGLGLGAAQPLAGDRHLGAAAGGVGDGADQRGVAGRHLHAEHRGHRGDRHERQRAVEVGRLVERRGLGDAGPRRHRRGVAHGGVHQRGGVGVGVSVGAGVAQRALEGDRRRQAIGEARRAVDPARDVLVVVLADRAQERAGGDDAGRRGQQAEAGGLGDDLGADQEHRGQRAGRGQDRAGRGALDRALEAQPGAGRADQAADHGEIDARGGRRCRVVSHGVRLLGGAAAAPCSTVQTAPTFRKALTPSTRSIAPSFDAPTRPEVYRRPCRVGHPPPSPVSRFACASRLAALRSRGHPHRASRAGNRSSGAGGRWGRCSRSEHSWGSTRRPPSRRANGYS